MPHWATTHFTFRKTNGNWLMYFVKLDAFFLFSFFFFFKFNVLSSKSLALFISCSLWQSSWNQRQIWSDSKFRFSYSAMPDTVFLHIWGGTRVFISHLWSKHYPISNLSIGLHQLCLWCSHCAWRFWCISWIVLAYLWGREGRSQPGNGGRHLVISGFSILCTYLDNSSRATFSSIFTWKE